MFYTDLVHRISKAGGYGSFRELMSTDIRQFFIMVTNWEKEK